MATLSENKKRKTPTPFYIPRIRRASWHPTACRRSCVPLQRAASACSKFLGQYSRWGTPCVRTQCHRSSQSTHTHRTYGCKCLYSSILPPGALRSLQMQRKPKLRPLGKFALSSHALSKRGHDSGACNTSTYHWLRERHKQASGTRRG